MTRDAQHHERIATVKMRAISVRQPWAWAILHAGKDIENRFWSTRYRGQLLLHAARARPDPAEIESGASWSDYDLDVPQGAAFPRPEELRYGGIVGMVELVDCVESSSSPWFVGPYGFVLARPRPLPFVSLRGALGLFAVDAKLLQGEAAAAPQALSEPVRLQLFDQRQDKDACRKAEAHAVAGGQALHVWEPGPDGWPGAPAVFLRSRPWAHLFDQNEWRLRTTARGLGVRSVLVERQGQTGQHVDLCAAPLQRALEIATGQSRQLPEESSPRGQAPRWAGGKAGAAALIYRGDGRMWRAAGRAADPHMGSRCRLVIEARPRPGGYGPLNCLIELERGERLVVPRKALRKESGRDRQGELF